MEGSKELVTITRLVRADHIISVTHSGRTIVYMQDYESNKGNEKPPSMNKPVIIAFPVLNDYADLRKQLTGKHIVEPDMPSKDFNKVTKLVTS